MYTDPTGHEAISTAATLGFGLLVGATVIQAKITLEQTSRILNRTGYRRSRYNGTLGNAILGRPMLVPRTPNIMTTPIMENAGINIMTTPSVENTGNIMENIPVDLETSLSGYGGIEKEKGSNVFNSSKTEDPLTGREVGRFIGDSKGNVLIEPVGGKTVPRGENKEHTYTLYPNGSNYQRFEPQGHISNGSGGHAHGHLEGTKPGMNGQGDSIDISGKPVDYFSKPAHWDIKK